MPKRHKTDNPCLTSNPETPTTIPSKLPNLLKNHDLTRKTTIYPRFSGLANLARPMHPI